MFGNSKYLTLVPTFHVLPGSSRGIGLMKMTEFFIEFFGSPIDILKLTLF